MKTIILSKYLSSKISKMSQFNMVIEIISNISKISWKKLIFQLPFVCLQKRKGVKKLLKEKEAIEYLDTLEVGNYLTVNIPIFRRW